MRGFRLSTALRNGSEACLTAEGRVTATDAAQLVILLRALLEAGARRIVVDLARVDSCDPVVVEHLRREQRAVEASGGWMMIDGSPATLHGMEPDLDEVFRIYRQATGPTLVGAV